MIAALGESIVAVGIGVQDRRPTEAGYVAACAALVLAASFWWAHFAADDDSPKRSMVGAPPAAQARIALNGYYFAFVPMLVGIVAAAAGVARAIRHAKQHLDTPHALLLGGGAAAYVGGSPAFRLAMGIARSGSALLRTVLALGTTAAGRFYGAVPQLVLLVAVLVALCSAERHLRAATPRLVMSTSALGAGG